MRENGGLTSVLRMANSVMRLCSKVRKIHNLFTQKPFCIDLKNMYRSARLESVLAQYRCVLYRIRTGEPWFVLRCVSYLDHKVVDYFNTPLAVKLIEERFGSFVAAPFVGIIFFDSEKPKARMGQSLFTTACAQIQVIENAATRDSSWTA